MLLSNVNTVDIVTKHILNYLTQYDFTFVELKKIIIDKKPLSEIQTQIISTLTEYKKEDWSQIQVNLEQQAYLNQLSLDETDKEKDLKKRIELEHIQIELNQKLNEIANQQLELNNQYRLLTNKINQLKSTKPIENALYHPQIYHIEKIQQLENQQINHEKKQGSLSQRQSMIQSKLKEINNHLKEIARLDLERQYREEARIAYQANHEGIYETLSPINKEKLRKNCHDQNAALEKKRDALISDAEEINYSTILEQLNFHLPRLKIKRQEIEALRLILKLMDQHFHYAQLALSIEKQVQIKRKSISNQQLKLNDKHHQLNQLKINEPHFFNENELIKNHIINLQSYFENNIQFSRRLGVISFFLFITAATLSIPLLLVHTGMLPLFMSSALLYFLFSTPPALTLLTSLSLGTAAIIFGYRAYFSENQITSNEQTIINNINQMKRDSNKLNQLALETLPTIEKQLKKDESTLDKLTHELIHHKKSAEEFLNQAKSVKPSNQGQLFFSKQLVQSNSVFDYEIKNATKCSLF